MPPSYRENNRRQLRDALVTAARDLTVANGWDGVRMADVATAVGVSRQTVYNELGDKAGLAEALAAAEIERFVADVRQRLAEHPGDVHAAGHAAILHTLTEAGQNPLLKAILTRTDDLLPFLTTRADLVLAAAGAVIQEWAAAHRPDLPADDVARAAECVVRLTVSHIILPTAPVSRTADVLADALVRLLRLD
jgi:AcrR family transcriptional regulator